MPVAVKTERGLVLVDVGPEGIADALEVRLSDLGYGLEDIWLVSLTHHDGDHVGEIEEGRARADPIVAAHPEEMLSLSSECCKPLLTTVRYLVESLQDTQRECSTESCSICESGDRLVEMDHISVSGSIKCRGSITCCELCTRYLISLKLNRFDLPIYEIWE
ncbi:MBL fold metallo-hydrolase [Natribaculum luteum]|uniref:MBL fold metallo-hydrolase n=1 Tax=Natribaculum luteum TaxID=1586232 RepID=A0ABD5P0R0_9EURY|nr:MBL fold metallo-hydrolase [Natribaculum luteum]